MTVQFFTFSKRINSTKRPTTPGMELSNVLLKDSTTVNSPILEIKARLNNPYIYNYMYIPELKRYYTIGSWTYNRGVWIVEASVDLLATFRRHIGETICPIERTSLREDQDSGLVDTMYPISTLIYPFSISKEASYVGQTGDAWTIARTPYDGGYFVVGVLNGNSVIGACQYYFLTPKAFYQTVSYLMRLNPYSFEDSLTAKANPLQYINSCRWIPLTESMLQAVGYEPVNNIFLYQANNQESVTLALDSTQYGQSYIAVDESDVPDHGVYAYFETELPKMRRRTGEDEYEYNWNCDEDKARQYMNDPLWLRCNFDRYTLTAPYIGTVDLSPEVTGLYLSDDGGSLYLRYRIDIQSGDAVVVLSETPYGTKFQSEETVGDFYSDMIQTWVVPFGTPAVFGIRENNTADIILSGISTMATTLNVTKLSPPSSIDIQPASSGSYQMVPYQPPRGGALTESKERINLFDDTPTPPKDSRKTYNVPIKGAIAGRIAQYASNTATRGASGSYVDNTDQITVNVYRARLSGPQDPDIFGYACAYTAQVSAFKATEDHPGFIKCHAAVVVPQYETDEDGNITEAVATASDIEAIQAIMCDGFYYDEKED